jgi:hypothetical protein
MKGKFEIEVKGVSGNVKTTGYGITYTAVEKALAEYFNAMTNKTAPDPLQEGKIIIKISYPKD